MNTQQLSPETKIKLENFVKQIESATEYDSEIRINLNIPPTLIEKYLLENGYKLQENWDDYEEFIDYIRLNFRKRNPKYYEENVFDEFFEFFRIELHIKPMYHTSRVIMGDY